MCFPPEPHPWALKKQESSPCNHNLQSCRGNRLDLHVFGPVWTTFYILMGISLYLIRKKYEEGKDAKPALTIFSIQWVLNALWPFLFLGLQSPLYGLLCISPLRIAIALMIVKYHSLSKNAALLQIPYLLWVSFATILNASIWLLN